MMSMRFLFSRTRRALVGAGLLLLVALAVACGGGGGGGSDGGGGGNGNGGGNNGNNGNNGGTNSGQIDAPRFLELPASSVTVAATADDGNAVLTIKVADATLPPFARSGFMSDGGATATIALALDATAIFDFDDKVASLTLSVTNSVGAATATIRFVSAPRLFTDDLLSISVTATNAIAGATILAAGAASISIWHNGTMAIEEYDISPDDGNFGVDLTTGLVTAATNLTSGETYNLNLSLTDNAGYSVSRLLRVTVGALFVDLPASPVVAAAVDVGDAILTITVAGATLQSFARSGFRSAGGEMATISLVSDPVSIFTFDNAVVSLTITLSDSRRTIAATLRFVSAPRVIAADLLSISVAALEAVAGEAILAAGAAEISIWHNGTAAIEEYDISPDDGNFGVDSATGLVTATTDLTPDETYNLTLHLIDRALSLTASRSLRVAVGVLLPLEFVDLPASSVVVAADADIGDAILTITATGAALPPFARSGFMSDGGETATIALASIPADIFTLDYAVASLALTLSDPRRTIAATVRFVSAPRAVAAESLRIPVAALDAIAGVTILAAGAAKISIWHNDAGAVEEYKISPDDGDFGVDSATGLVTATTDLTPDATYNLTLHLVDSTLALTASRSLRVTVGALPPLEFVGLSASSSVVVAAAADIGDAILTITAAGAALPSFARSGFMSDGGALATIALASIPADIFTLDYAVASLALTLSDRLRTVAATIRFVSAPRAVAADLLSISVAALDAVEGAAILAAGAAEISIWHNDAAAVEEYEISPDDGNFGVDSATGLVTAMTDLTPDATYNLTLHLIDRGLALTASRSLQAVVGVLPPLDFVGLSASSSVVVAAAADIGDAVLTITVAGATLPSFARSGFRSDGGALATIALTSLPVDIFTLDYAVASLAFTLSDRRQTVAATVRFVSAPRAIAADLLSISVAALEAVAGAAILAAGEAKISIWHNDAADEEYKISPDGGDFGVDSATGLVTATTNLTPDETYNLTLHLIDRGLSLTASRSLRVTVGVLPPLKFVDLPASSVVVAAAANIGDSILTITVAGATLPSFARSGFMSNGGETATISLASDATAVFDSDNAVALLSFTLSDRRRTVAATVRFVSALRVITDDLLRIPVAAFEAVAGATILAAGAAEISIWHNGAAAIEEYAISPDDGNFGVDSATGLVTAAMDLTPGETYNLNLSLIDNARNAVSRSLRVTVGALLPLGFVDLPVSSVVVAAAADMGDAVLTITVAGAALPPFARSGFMSDGGAMAAIALASEATVVFDSDNAVASLALTLAGGAETATATIRFVSAPRVIAPAAATIFVSFIDAVAGGTILATGAAGVSIWHNGAAAIEEYEISSAGDFFGVDSATGLVTAAMDLTIGDSYDFTLRVIDDALSLTASRSLRAAAVNLGPLQSRYLSTVEWSVVNAYDYLVEQDGETIDLRVVGGVMADGATRETAFPIYNIWQLQAIDGLRGNPFSSSFLATATLFGANTGERLGRHYRLMNDIDAGPTRRWAGGMGFHPIGDSEPQRAGLRGGLYGDGYAIRDLWIDRPYSLRVGLFAVVDGGVIDSVGIEDARIAGLGYVGALVGEQIGGAIQNAWASGAVTSDGWRVGGLVGRNDGGVIFDSWTRSDVRGDRRVGGLVGAVDIRNIGGVRTVPVIERGQAMGNVRGNGDVGGLVGRNGGGMISDSRSFATVTGEENIGGLIGSSFAGDIGFNGSTGPVRGNINVGGLVGRHVRAAVAGNWSIAAVTGKENVGGLVGNIISDGAVVFNWSAGSARGDFGIGGLIGRNRHAEVENNWSVASASGEQFVGGLLGRVENGNDITDHVQNNWSGGAVTAQKNGGGMLGYARRDAIPYAYWSEETSGTTFSWGNNILGFAHRGIPSMQESTDPLFESDDWHNGDSDLSDNAADFPVLANYGISLQWAGLAYGLTRVLAAANGAEMAEWGERREMSRGAATIRIDTNAMASDTRAEFGVTSTPDCALVGGVLRATTNYNGAIVLARAEGGVLSSANGCEAVLTPNAGVRRATLHLAFAAAGATLRRTHEMRYFDAGDLDARADFLANVEWSKAYARGDEDDDGIPNAYDYRPRGDSFDLRFDEDGAFYDFWPIYNVWQLQAIDGETPGYAGGEDLFGVLEPIRLGGRYRLMNDIDASVTEEWSGGFAPIGDYHSSFGGEFMGGGYVVKNLRINRPNDFRAGLFAHLTGEVRGLGMTGRVAGDYEVGGLVGYMPRGLLSDSWSLAAVSGALWVGGLAGRQGGGRIERSWSSGRVRAEIDGGGLVGDQAGGAMVNSWSSGSVESDYDAGGLVGDQTFDAGIATTWSAGSATATAIGGVAGGLLGSSFGFVAESYWSEETSGRLRSAAGEGVATAQTLSQPEWNISDQIWNFGDGELSDGDGDFPVLSGLSEEWQATGLGLGLARVLAVNGAGEIALRAGETNIVDEAAFAALRLDANGLAADDGGDRTSSPSCRFVAGMLEAETNYNGATLRLRLLPTTAGELRAYDSGRCEAGFAVTGSGAATLRVESSSGSARAHFDYPLDLRALLSPPSPVDEGGGAALSIYAPRRLLLPSRAEAGYVALTASVSAGAIEASSGDGFSTGGGSIALVTLTEAATTAFAVDGARLIFALAATASGNRAATATAIFGSRPLALDGGITTVSLRALRAVSGRLLLSALSVSAGVKHYEGERYRLANDYGGLFAADPESGEIRLSRRVDAAVDAVLELRAEGGGVAGTQSLRVQAPAALISEGRNCELGQQWRCRDEFYAILTAAIAAGEATLNDNQAVVLDSGNHGRSVLNVFAEFGSGAVVAFHEFLNNRILTPRAYFLSHATFDTDNRKPIINHSVTGAYERFVGLDLSVFNRRDAIFVQSSGNSGNFEPDYHLFNGSHFDRERAEAIAETGRLVVVGGYQLISEQSNGDLSIGLVFSGCGFAKEYCLIAEGIGVPPGDLNGTSFAAPQVAAALQMLATMWPELSQDSLVSLLLALASDVTLSGAPETVGVDAATGHGLLSFRRLFSADGAMGFKCSIAENACVSDYF